MTDFYERAITASLLWASANPERPMKDVLEFLALKIRALATRERMERLRAGREEKSLVLGRRVEGSAAFGHTEACHIAAAKAIYMDTKSLRGTSKQLQKLGMMNLNGKPYGAGSISKMVKKDPRFSK